MRSALHMSAFGAKRTCRVRREMSAFHPKRTAKGDIGHVLAYKSTEFAHPHFPVRPQRRKIVGSYESHCGSASHIRLQHSEKSTRKPSSTLRLSYADRAIKIAIGRGWKIAQHGLNDHHVRLRHKLNPQDVANDPAIMTPHYKRFLKYRVPVPISCLTN